MENTQGPGLPPQALPRLRSRGQPDQGRRGGEHLRPMGTTGGHPGDDYTARRAEKATRLDSRVAGPPAGPSELPGLATK